MTLLPYNTCKYDIIPRHEATYRYTLSLAKLEWKFSRLKGVFSRLVFLYIFPNTPETHFHYVLVFACRQVFFYFLLVHLVQYVLQVLSKLLKSFNSVVCNLLVKKFLHNNVFIIYFV